MKILVIQNENIKTSQNKDFIKAVEGLKRLGHNIKLDTEFQKNGKLTEGYSTKIDKVIRESDIVIAEVSNPDLKVGIEISKALSERKVVLALYKDKTSASIDAITTNDAKTLLVKKYSTANIDKVIASSIDEAKGKLDTKFILIISSEIDRYLDWSSQHRRMHKAQVVRTAVEALMKKDKEYNASK